MSTSRETGTSSDALEPSPLPDTIAEAAERLRAGTLTAVGLARACLEGIARLEHRLKAFITVTEDEALTAAEALDLELRQGKDRGILHGIPIVHKDLYDTAGVLTTFGSELFRQRIPREDAAVVRKLRKAGTVMLGKTNLSEFAASTSGSNRAYGDTSNPWSLTCSAGGSSSGTAAAVAAGLCLGGTGSDTGGSIRIPASWSGIVGLRPTFGLVSLDGCHPRAYSLDCGGPLARTVADVAVLLNAMVGYDPRYRHSIRAPKVDYTADLDKGVKGLRLGLVEDEPLCDVDQQVVHAVQAAANRLAELGAEVKTVKVPVLSEPVEDPPLLDVLLYEFNRILGERYRAIENKEEMFEPIVRANIARGEAISRESYEKLLAERPKRIAAMKEIFREVDALLTPTTPMTAPPLDAGPEVYDRARRFTLPISFLGLPAVSVPCGFSAAGLPIGMHLVGDALQEALLLRIAAAFEEATRFYRRRPPVHIARELEASA